LNVDKLKQLQPEFEYERLQTTIKVFTALRNAAWLYIRTEITHEIKKY